MLQLKLCKIDAHKAYCEAHPLKPAEGFLTKDEGQHGGYKGHHCKEHAGARNAKFSNCIGPAGVGRCAAKEGKRKDGINNRPAEVEARFKTAYTLGEKHRDEEDAAKEELVHYYHRWRIFVAESLCKGNLAYLRYHCDEQDAYSQPEQRARLGCGVCYYPEAGYGYEYSKDVQSGETLLEDEHSHNH